MTVNCGGAGVEPFFNHYRGQVEPEDVDAYWSLTPESLGLKPGAAYLRVTLWVLRGLWLVSHLGFGGGSPELGFLATLTQAHTTTPVTATIVPTKTWVMGHVDD